MAFIADYILDLALSALDTEATHLYVCSQEPTTLAEATTTYALGVKATPTIGAPANRSPNGRKVTVSAITDGSVTASGTATHWALVDANLATLMATGPLNSAQAVTNGNTFTLSAFDVGIPDAT